MVDDKVSREEFDAFAKEVTDAICLLKTQLGTPKEVGVALYRCDEEGCRYVTDDVASFIEHVIDERLKGHPSPSPMEEGFASAEQPKRRQN